MKLLLTAILGASFLYASGAVAQSLIEAKTTADAALAIQTAEVGRADLIRDAVGLGVADPVELIFALVSPVTAAGEVEEVARALTLAAPRKADEIAAATAIAAAIVDDEDRLISLIDALLTGLAAAPLNDAARAEETREILAALLAVTDPELRIVLADAVAGGDGATLLAALGDGPETAAINAPSRPFGDGPLGLTLTPGSAAQDAPSAN